jgi:hypothetical protein
MRDYGVEVTSGQIDLFDKTIVDVTVFRFGQICSGPPNKKGKLIFRVSTADVFFQGFRSEGKPTCLSIEGSF